MVVCQGYRRVEGLRWTKEDVKERIWVGRRWKGVMFLEVSEDDICGVGIYGIEGGEEIGERHTKVGAVCLVFKM